MGTHKNKCTLVSVLCVTDSFCFFYNLREWDTQGKHAGRSSSSRHLPSKSSRCIRDHRDTPYAIILVAKMRSVPCPILQMTK